jgi:hypothetical protein
LTAAEWADKIQARFHHHKLRWGEEECYLPPEVPRKDTVREQENRMEKRYREVYNRLVVEMEMEQVKA